MRGGSPLAIGSASARGGEVGMAGHEAAPVAAARALAQLLAQRGDDLGVELAAEGAHGLQLAAAVEDERRVRR